MDEQYCFYYESESNSTMDQVSCILDIKLRRLTCPFTWKMENVIKNRNKLLGCDDDRFELVVDKQDIFPEHLLIWHLMLAYENTMSDQLENATNAIREAEMVFADIKKKETLKNAENVLEHIFVATKCHVLKRLEKLTEVNELLKNICKIDETKIDSAESAMLNGCLCLAWKLYRTPQTLEEINFAKKAVQCEPTNGKWHYLLGKSYRAYRRKQQSLNDKPNENEALAFQQAYELSKNVLFGVSLARLHRESFNYEEANKIYKEIYDLQPTSCTVRLQLALGFIRTREFALAKHCLDYVAEKLPDSLVYIHYMGIYEEKCNKDLKAALSYYQIAVDKSNYGAEWQYLSCKQQLEPDWDPLAYLLEVLKKYEKDSAHTLQEINVQIGTYYLFEKRDILSACLCLKKAIEIQPKARILKNHRLLFGQRVFVNIYDVLSKEVRFALQGSSIDHDEDTIEVLNSTLQLCNEYNKNVRSESCGSLRGAWRSQSSLNRSQNRGRGYVSHRGNNSRENQPNSISSFRSSTRNYSSRGSGNLRNLSKENSWKRSEINNGLQKLSSQSTASCSGERNVTEKYKSGVQRRNDLPKRSDTQTTESSRTKLYQPPRQRHNLRNEKTPEFGNRVPVSHIQRGSFSKLQDKSESSGDAAECVLVKTRNLKL